MNILKKLAAFALAAAMTAGSVCAAPGKAPISGANTAVSAAVREKSEKLPAPENFRAIAYDGKIVLKWDHVSGADMYRVYMKNSAGKYKKYDDAPAASCAIAIPDVTDGKKYYFKVAALVGREGRYTVHTRSKKLTVTGRSGKVPAPASLKATPNETRVKLEWKEPAGAEYYKIYRYSEAAGSYIQVYQALLVKENYTIINDLQPDTEYKFKVASVIFDEYSKSTEQSLSDAVTVKTTKAPKLSEFTEPEFGLSPEKALKASGIADYLYITERNGTRTYSGRALLLGKEATVLLSFNENKEFCAYALTVNNSRSDFEKLVKRYTDDKSWEADPKNVDDGYNFKRGTVAVMMSFFDTGDLPPQYAEGLPNTMIIVTDAKLYAGLDELPDFDS